MKRAYGHEPILLASSPVTPRNRPVQSAPRSWRKVAVIGIIIVVLGMGTLATVFLRGSGSSGNVLGQVAGTVGFPLYEPAWLPEGWSIDRQSISVTTEVVTFTVNDAHGQRLVFTEQPKPPQDNLDTFYDQQLSGNSSSDSAVGKVVKGQFEGSSLAGVSTDQTWILIRAVSAVDQQQFSRLADNLKKIDR